MADDPQINSSHSRDASPRPRDASPRPRDTVLTGPREAVPFGTQPPNPGPHYHGMPTGSGYTTTGSRMTTPPHSRDASPRPPQRPQNFQQGAQPHGQTFPSSHPSPGFPGLRSMDGSSCAPPQYPNQAMSPDHHGGPVSGPYNPGPPGYYHTGGPPPSSSPAQGRGSPTPYSQTSPNSKEARGPMVSQYPGQSFPYPPGGIGYPQYPSMGQYGPQGPYPYKVQHSGGFQQYQGGQGHPSFQQEGDMFPPQRPTSAPLHPAQMSIYHQGQPPPQYYQHPPHGFPSPQGQQGDHPTSFLQPPQRQTPEKESSRTIQVKGLAKNMSEDTLSLYFESSKHSGGGDVGRVEMRGNRALITFTEPEVAERVLSREHKIDGKHVTVSLSFQESSRTISVTGCDPVKDLELVQMYFESKKRSGGGPTEEVKKKKNSILVRFEDEEDYRRVLEHESHVVAEKHLKIQPVTDEDSENRSDKSSDNDDEDDANKQTNSVEIRGYPIDSSDDNITLYFENSKKSGGGDCELVSRNDKKGVIVLKYENSEVAKRVVSREHKLRGVGLRVKLCAPQRMYKDRVLLTGVPESTEEELSLYLESRSGLDVAEFLYGEEQGEILVSFESSLKDIVSLDNAMMKKTFKNSTIAVSSVPRTSSITVRDVPGDASEETLRLYFENNRRSGGGDVEDVLLNQAEKFAVITFADGSVAETVCKRPHHMNDNPVQVNLHFECLGSAGGSKEPPCTEIPDPVEVPVDTYLVQFVSSSPLLEIIISQLDDKNTRLGLIGNAMRLIPKFSKDDKLARQFVETWAEVSKSVLQEFLDNIVVERIDVNFEIWPDVETKTKDIGERTNVKIFLEEQKWIVIVVGEKDAVKDTSEKVKEIARAVLAEHERRKSQISETKHFIPGKLRVLIGQGVIQSMTTTDLSVCADAKTGDVELKGTQKEVQDAILQLFETINNIIEDTVPNVSPNRLDLFRRPEVEDYLLSLQRRDGQASAGSWALNRDKLVMYYLDEGERDSVIAFLKMAVRENTLYLDTDNTVLLTTIQFQRMVDQLCAEKKARVLISPKIEESQIQITAVADDIEYATDTVNIYLEDNTIYTVTLDFSQNVLRFLALHCKDKMDMVCQDLKKHSAQYIPEAHGQMMRIKIKATKGGIDQAKMLFSALASRVKGYKQNLEKPGIQTFLESGDILSQIETSTRCVFSRTVDDGQTVDQTESSNTFDKMFFCRFEPDKEVTVVVGDLSSLANDVDVIVVEATSRFEPASSQASTVFGRVGKNVQEELQQVKGAFFEGDVYCGIPGQLPCKLIIYGIAPIPQSRDEKVVIESIIMSSLEEAEKKNMHSVALPSFSDTSLSPDERHAVIMENVKAYFEENHRSSITEVSVCINESSQCQSAWNQTVAVFGEERVIAKQTDSASVYEANTLRHRRRQGVRQNVPVTSVNVPEEPPAEPVPPPPVPTPVVPTVSDLARPRILLVKADMGIEEADVIVNSSNIGLNLENGMVSRSLLKHAGESIQAECKASYPDGIKQGDIAVTKGGDMQCVEQIYHCVLPNFDKTTGKQTLADTINALLTKAEQGNWRTIAIPALGTGNLGYPRDLVADVMYETVAQYGKDNPNTSLSDVLFIVYPGDQESCQVFEAANKKHVEAMGGSVANSQDEIDIEREAELEAYRQKLVADKQLRSNPVQPASKDKPTGASSMFSNITKWVKSKMPDFSSLRSYPQNPSTAEMSLMIYTDDQANVQRAIDMIYDEMSKSIQSRELKEDIVKKWTGKQISDLKQLERHGVTIDVNKRMGRIRVQGLLENLSDAMPHIHQFIREEEKKEQEAEYAEQLQKIVQWYYLELNEHTAVEEKMAYDKTLNAKLEKAYQGNKSRFQYEDYVFDFQKWVEYPEDDPSDEATIIRKDLIAATSTALPTTWDGSSDDSKLVALQNDSPEYKTVEKNIQDCFQAVGSTAEVVRIDRVQNKTLYQQYQAKRIQMEQKGETTVIEKSLWHGTNKDYGPNICHLGFNRSNCDKSQSTYGQGVYFTASACEAAKDTYAPADAQGKRQIFQSRVLTGSYAQGNQGLRVPPPRDPKRPTVLYDSVVNDVTNPSIYVIFNDTQAYPEYFITVKC